MTGDVGGAVALPLSARPGVQVRLDKAVVIRRWAGLLAGWFLLAGLAWLAFSIASARHLPDTLFAALLDMLGFAAVGFLLFAHALALLAQGRPGPSDSRTPAASAPCDGERVEGVAAKAESCRNGSSGEI